MVTRLVENANLPIQVAQSEQCISDSLDAPDTCVPPDASSVSDPVKIETAKPAKPWFAKKLSDYTGKVIKESSLSAIAQFEGEYLAEMPDQQEQFIMDMIIIRHGFGFFSDEEISPESLNKVVFVVKKIMGAVKNDVFCKLTDERSC
jgi:hypothetical protein